MERLIPSEVKEQWEGCGRDVASLLVGLGAKQIGKRVAPGGRFLNALLIQIDLGDDGGDGGRYDSDHDDDDDDGCGTQPRKQQQKQKQQHVDNNMGARWTRTFENANFIFLINI